MNLDKCIHTYNPYSGLLREMSDFRAGAGSRKDELGAPCNAQTMQVLGKKIGEAYQKAT